MKQGSAERVCEFAHRFHDVQNELIKLIPNNHLIPDGSDVELRHAFTIKLRPEIKREIEILLIPHCRKLFKCLNASRKFTHPQRQSGSIVQLRSCPSMLTKYAKRRHFRHVAFVRKPTI